MVNTMYFYPRNKEEDKIYTKLIIATIEKQLVDTFKEGEIYYTFYSQNKQRVKEIKKYFKKRKFKCGFITKRKNVNKENNDNFYTYYLKIGLSKHRIMKEITFEYQTLSKPYYGERRCGIFLSLDECIKTYKLDKEEVNYKIINIKDVLR